MHHALTSFGHPFLYIVSHVNVITLTATQQKYKIVKMGDSFTSFILTRFSTFKFSFVLITRTFHKWQYIQKQRSWKHFIRKTPDFVKYGIKKLSSHSATVVENKGITFFMIIYKLSLYLFYILSGKNIYFLNTLIFLQELIDV